MAFCTNCGKELPADAKFCSECGAKVNMQSSTQTAHRKTVYDGEVHKCPNCGEIIDAYDMICKSCGYEIRGRKTTSVVHELSLKLENTSDPQKKDELIRTFYIPNTREDIHEFFMLAMSQVKIGGTNTDAWMVKLEQAYQKAELSFPNTQEFDRLKILYEKVLRLDKKKSAFQFVRSMGKYFKSGYAWALLFFGIGSLLSVVPVLWSIADGFRAIALIIAGVTLYGRVWRALDKK